ncbi:MAG: 4Fe-4S ferredoxin [Kiritimatiellaeota bacterium]|nr:4Fe-4S ferredoxin [Kiritimatiellota bacterium]
MPEIMNEIERQKMDADIVCVGFGPATAGFLTTLTRAMMNADGTPAFESKVMPGMPLQVMCYERADDIGFGVSGIVTKGRAIRASFPGLDLAKEIPNATVAEDERVAYLHDPIGASRRTAGTRFVDAVFKAGRFMMRKGPHAEELPWIPPFLRKEHGLVMSMGSFMSWVGGQLMGSGLVQIWPGTPVSTPLIEDGRVTGVRLADQGVDKKGNPEGAFMPGMDIGARLTVVGDGPVGAVGRTLDAHFGLPAGNHQHDWAVGMKAVVELPPSCGLKPGTVIHTLGFPEPEIFGFMYVYPDRTASLGIFVPSWFDSPARTGYRYLQHWMQHPYLWRHLEGGTLRSWGAKTLQESGVRGEPHLVGDGFARIGEGSGTSNLLTNSGVDEAWRSGVLLAEGAIEILKADGDFTKPALAAAYEKRRRADTLNKELQAAKKARDGFQNGFMLGMMGTGLTGITGGALNVSVKSVPPSQKVKPLAAALGHRIPADKLAEISEACAKTRQPLHDAVMNAMGWPEVTLDGNLLMSHQDILFKGGKVQAMGGFADHVRFADPARCASCTERTCVEMCSAQAVMPGEDGGVPEFDREKCVHCGACVWSCSKAHPTDPERNNIEFTAGSGGLHSNEN